MDVRARAEAHFAGLARLAADAGPELARAAETLAREIGAALRAGGKVMFCGNGGSAADAQHLAAEYVVRFREDRGPLAAVALTTDTSVLTAAGNDYGFEDVFARQVEALGRPGDVLVLHSTSGESENLLRAAEAATRAGVRSWGVLARGGGRLRERVDAAVVVPTDDTAHAQELHLAFGHAVCDAVERLLSVGGRPTSEACIAVLTQAYERERAQARFYRDLAAQALQAEEADEAGRLNELLADEQHHVSRLAARLLELGARPSPQDVTVEGRPVYTGGWEDEARAREEAEVDFYRGALSLDLDGGTRQVFEEILEAEEGHRRHLGGKWMSATRPRTQPPRSDGHE